MTVEERELLLAVGRIVGGIQVDGDPRGASVPPAPLLRDDGLGQHVRYWAGAPPPDRTKWEFVKHE